MKLTSFKFAAVVPTNASPLLLFWSIHKQRKSLRQRLLSEPSQRSVQINARSLTSMIMGQYLGTYRVDLIV